MHSNPISRLKNQLSSSFIDSWSYFGVIFFNPLFHFLVQCLDQLYLVSSCITYKHTTDNRQQIKRCKWVKPINNFKRRTMSGTMNSLLYANLTNGKESFQDLTFFEIVAWSKESKVLLTTSVCPSIWGWHVVENNNFVPNLSHNTFQKWL